MAKYDKIETLLAMKKGLDLRLKGFTYEEISEQVVMTNGERIWSTGKSASASITKAMKAKTSLDFQERRMEEIHRIDKVIQIIWSQIEGGNLAAIDRLATLQNQMMKMVENMEVDKKAKLDLEGGPLQVIFTMPEPDRTVVPEPEHVDE